MASSQSGVGRNPTWSKDELILALDFYLRHAGSIPNKNSRAIFDLQQQILNAARRAQLTGNDKFRNRNGVYMKLMNFRRLDPKFKSIGLRHSGKREEALWAELSGDVAQCARLAEQIRNRP